jgi:hypothetical protein
VLGLLEMLIALQGLVAGYLVGTKSPILVSRTGCRRRRTSPRSFVNELLLAYTVSFLLGDANGR